MSPELKFHDGGTLEEVDEINRVRQIEFGIQEWKNLNKWTNKHNFVAVIQLEYDMSSWKARDTLRLLGVANDIGIKDCVWQLGSGRITHLIFYFNFLIYCKNRTEFNRDK